MGTNWPDFPTTGLTWRQKPEKAQLLQEGDMGPQRAAKHLPKATTDRSCSRDPQSGLGGHRVRSLTARRWSR